MATASRSLATALQGRARSRLALPSYTTSWDVTSDVSRECQLPLHYAPFAASNANTPIACGSLDFAYSRQTGAEHFQQCAQFALLRNRGLGPLAVTVLPVPLACRPAAIACAAVQSTAPLFRRWRPARLPAPGPRSAQARRSSPDPLVGALRLPRAVRSSGAGT